MFVVHRKRRGFVHIARTGGTWVKACTEAVPTRDRIRSAHRPQLTPSEDQVLSQYQWCAVIRDPVERFRSLWQQHLRIYHHTRLQRRMRGQEDFPYIQTGYRVPIERFQDWACWIDWWRDRPIPSDHKSMWDSQVSKIRSNTLLFAYSRGLKACVSWLGGRTDAAPANSSDRFDHSISTRQRSIIQQRYAANQALYESMESQRSVGSAVSAATVIDLESY